MPYEMHWENAGLHKRFFGELTIGDVVNSSIELHRSHRFDALKFSINDFSGVSGLSKDIDLSALEDLAAASIGASLTKPNFRIAVVTSDPVIAELSRKYVTTAGSTWTVELFPTLEAARQWISEWVQSGSQ
jgi:hypothetical protein